MYQLATSTVCNERRDGDYSVSQKQTNNPAAATTTLRVGVWGGLGCNLLQFRAKGGGGFVVALRTVVCADEGPDLLCLLFFLVSLVDSCLGSEETLCVFIRGWLSDSDVCQFALLPF